MTDKFPVAEFELLKKKWENNGTGGFQKYFERYQWCLETCETRMKALDMMDGNKLKILDISTGFGFFPWLCMQYGHYVAITDAWEGHEFGFFSEVHDLLDLPLIQTFIYFGGRFRELPGSIGEFDMITACHVDPHGVWYEEEWRNYITDCKKHLNDNGRIVICPNNSAGYDNLKELLNKNLYAWSMASDCRVIYK